MPPPVTDTSPLPKYLDLCQQVEEQIASGELKPGDRLPSFVQMREQYGATTATVERILRTLEKKGLVRREPSRGTFVTARSHSQTKGVIGVLTQVAYRQHPYYSLLLGGAQEKAHELGVEILLLLENSVVSFDKVDGVIAMGAHEKPLRQIPLEMPKVSLMGVLPGMSGVTVDDSQGTRAAMEHLFALGHERIACLTLGNLPLGVEDVPNADIASAQRYVAYREALSHQGIEADSRWVRSLRDGTAPFRGFAISGREKMEQWVRENWRQLGCTALLAQNDEVAFQVIQVLQEHGYNVPEHVSVVGFDDTTLSTMIRPNLTTVNASLEQVGGRAVQMLLDKITDSQTSRESTRPNAIRLQTRLVVRQSTGPAPGKTKGRNKK